MNLANKLTMLRVVMIPAFVMPVCCAGPVCHSQLYGLPGRVHCPQPESGDGFRKIYGSSGR